MYWFLVLLFKKNWGIYNFICIFNLKYLQYKSQVYSLVIHIFKTYTPFIVILKCCCSVAKPRPTFAAPRIAACQASLSFTVSWSLLRLMSMELVMPPNHLILCPLALGLSQHQSAFHESAHCIRWPTYWNFSFSVSPSNEYSELISFRNWLVWSPCCARDSQESSAVPQFKSVNSSVLSFFYSPTLTSIHDYWKNHCFD